MSLDVKRVGILRGGEAYYDSSFKKGSDLILHIFDTLSRKYKPIDILIDKDGVWHVSGVPVDPADIIHKTDIVWDVTHPDSFVNINNISIPKVEISPFSSALKNSKEMLRKHMQGLKISMPRRIVLPLFQEDFDGDLESYASRKSKEVFAKFPSPWIVRSLFPNKNMGIHIAKTFNELVDAILDGVKQKESILIEEFVYGKRVSMHSVPMFRGEDIYVFPPSNVSDSEKEKLIQLVKDLHKHLGATYYLKSDFICNPRLGFFLTDVDFSPDMKENSHFAESCEYVGAKMHHIIEHILDKSIQ